MQVPAQPATPAAESVPAPAAPTAQPAPAAPEAAPAPDLNDAARRALRGFQQRQVIASVASNGPDESSAPLPITAVPAAVFQPAASEPLPSEQDDEADDPALTEAESEGAADGADPARKSRRQQAAERRVAELQQLRTQVEAEQAERLKLQQDAQARETRDAASRTAVAEVIGSDDEYQALLVRKARETDLGFLSAEDEQKLARWASNREILTPALDISRSEGRAAGQAEVLSIMDAEITKLAGEIQVPVSELTGKSSFAALARVFYDHAAARLTAAEQRVKELTDTNATLEAELSALRAKSAGAGRIPERGGQPGALAPQKPDLRSLPPHLRAAEALRQMQG